MGLFRRKRDESAAPPRGARSNYVLAVPVVTALVGVAVGFGVAGLRDGDAGGASQLEEVERLIDSATNGSEGSLQRRLAALGVSQQTSDLGSARCSVSQSPSSSDRDEFDCTVGNILEPEQQVALKRVSIADDDSRYGIYWEEPDDPTR